MSCWKVVNSPVRTHPGTTQNTVALSCQQRKFQSAKAEILKLSYPSSLEIRGSRGLSVRLSMHIEYPLGGWQRLYTIVKSHGCLGLKDIYMFLFHSLPIKVLETGCLRNIVMGNGYFSKPPGLHKH